MKITAGSYSDEYKEKVKPRCFNCGGPADGEPYEDTGPVCIACFYKLIKSKPCDEGEVEDG